MSISKQTTRKFLMAIPVAALTLAAAPATVTAGMLPTSIGAVGQAKPTATVDVRWRGRGYYGGWGPGIVAGGIAAGIIGGAIAAGGYPYGYGYGYWPGYTYYAPPPVYYGGPYYTRYYYRPYGYYYGYRRHWRPYRYYYW